MAEQDGNASGAQDVDVSGESGMRSLSGVEVGQRGEWSCLPIASVISPSARVSLIPSAHLLIVLEVAGATRMASAAGRTSGSGGSLYWLRTG